METRSYHLFPTPVSEYKLDGGFSEQELQSIAEMLKDRHANVGNETSNADTVLMSPELSRVAKFCESAISHYATEVMQLVDVKPCITQSWLNLSVKGQWHHMHSHPNSMFSGVLYVEAGGSDRIVFERRDKVMGGFFDVEAVNFNPANSDNWWLPAVTGSLLVFPSSLYHSVPPTESDRRVSLSFNTFPQTHIGSRTKLNFLPLGPISPWGNEQNES